MKLKEVKTRQDLATYIGLPLRYLTYVLYEKNTAEMYRTFEIPKKSGGSRKISAPNSELNEILKKFSVKLYKELKQIRKENNINQNVSHGFEEGKYFITNASNHTSKKCLLNVDLEDFFGSIHFGRVRGYFNKNKHFDLPIEIATMIAQLTCFNKCLPQGAPTSPVISNLICSIIDTRIAKLSRKFRLNYTRYVDDLSFSTNDYKFELNHERFLLDLEKIITDSGFKINKNKIRFNDKFHRHEVTGIIVNKKVNIRRDYYRENRALAHTYYKTGEVLINGKKGTFEQLEGRFSFINQITKYNNKNDKNTKHDAFNLNGVEREYQKLLAYKYYFNLIQPLIVTEGKTDSLYIKAALKNMYTEYTMLIQRENGIDDFDYLFSFLNRTRRLRYFFDLSENGAHTFKNIYQVYSETQNNKYRNFPKIKEFASLSSSVPKHPVILLLDNEVGKDRPLRTLLNEMKITEEFTDYINVIDNLYILKIPNLSGKDNVEIENLFSDDLLKRDFNGKTLNLSDKYNKDSQIGKDKFSKYVYRNYKEIDFSNFKPLLNSLIALIEDYQRKIET